MPTPPAEPPHPPPPDADLDRLIRRGFGYALSLTHDRALAEDVVQQALLQITRRGGPWHAGYLLTAVRHCWIDTGRRARVRTCSLASVADDELVEPAADSTPPAELLDGLLAHLEPEDREMLYLNAVEGYSAAEIGALTGRPRGTVLSRIFRAKKKLRRLAEHTASEASS